MWVCRMIVWNVKKSGVEWKGVVRVILVWWKCRIFTPKGRDLNLIIIMKQFKVYSIEDFANPAIFEHTSMKNVGGKYHGDGFASFCRVVSSSVTLDGHSPRVGLLTEEMLSVPSVTLRRARNRSWATLEWLYRFIIVKTTDRPLPMRRLTIYR